MKLFSIIKIQYLLFLFKAVTNFFKPKELNKITELKFDIIYLIFFPV